MKENASFSFEINFGAILIFILIRPKGLGPPNELGEIVHF